MNGLIYIAFGIEYDKMLAHCLFYSRRYTNLPIVVLTNLKEDERHIRWKSVSGIKFEYIEDLQDNNRNYKTNINKYSPFEKTLYLDADCIIQQKGIEKVFDKINDQSIMLNLYARWGETKKIDGLYQRHFDICNCALPLNVFYGAFIGFGKSEKIDTFFSQWNKNWINTGRGRDMPSLASSVKNTNIPVVELSNKDRVFTWIVRDGYIIQHEHGNSLRHLVGCPDFKQYKPFDKRQ